MTPQVGTIHLLDERPRRRRVHVLVDGQQAAVTSLDVLRSLHISEGDSADAAQLATDIAAAEPDAAMQRALRLLGYRERSIAELHKRLAEDGYAPSTIARVVDRLVDTGLANDARYTESFAHTKRASGWARERIARGLRDAGVPDDLASDALDSACPLENEILRAMALIQPIPSGDARARERALRRLVSRGYPWPVASAAVRARTNSDGADEGFLGES